jgi:DNA-binding transcriptional MerR regulator
MRNDAAFRTYTVSQLARLSGTSVRTLHHYDAIGLLKPAAVGENGYRYYGRTELLRLQQILLHREFGVALSDIPPLLAAGGPDRLKLLRQQRDRLAQQAYRYRRLARTIDRTIAELEGRETLMDKDLYDGFSPRLRADYQTWLTDEYGSRAADERIKRGQAAFAAMSEAQKGAWFDEALAIRDALADAMARGTAPEDAALDALLKRHYAWATQTSGGPLDAQDYIALGRLNVSNPEFRAMYDAARPGLAEWMAEAMTAYATRAMN